MHNWLITWHFFVHWTGGDYGANQYGHLEPYDWLSGVMGLSVLGLVSHNLAKHNCHARWCPRIGHYDYTDDKGVVYKLCAKHHPDTPNRAPTAEQIIGKVS